MSASSNSRRSRVLSGVFVSGLGIVLSAGLCGGQLGCGSSAKAPGEGFFAEVPANLEKDLAASCERTNPGVGAVREGKVRQGGSLALARQGDELIAYVADNDRDRLLVVNVTTKKLLASVETLGSPEQVEVLNDGRVIASIGSADMIQAFEPTGNPASPLQSLCARRVPAGPFGIATSEDGKTIAVTSAWEPALTELDESLHPKTVTELPRAPRGVLLEGKRALVAHLVGGTVSSIDLDDPKRSLTRISTRVRAGSAAAELNDLDVLREGTQAYALTSVEVTHNSQTNELRSDALGVETPKVQENAPQPLQVLPRTPTRPAIVPSPDPTPKPAAMIPAPKLPDVAPGTPGIRIVIPMVSVDPGSPERTTRNYYGPPPVAGVPKIAPVAVVLDPRSGKSLTSRVIASTGKMRADECILPRAVATKPNTLFVTCVGIDQLLELDARGTDPMRMVRARYEVPKGPTGVAIAEEENVAVVYSQFAEELAVVHLDGSLGESISLPGGKSHFDAVATAGRNVFYQADDPRITAEGLACSSCHPDATEDGVTWTTPEGPRQTPMLRGRLFGTAPYGWTRQQHTLETYVKDTCQRLGGTGLPDSDLSEVAAYISQIPSPPRHLSQSSAVTRGKEVFKSASCGDCHVGGTGTDAESHAFAEDKQEYDTPSLRDIGLTAPYFHDGRYRTLTDLLNDSTLPMGRLAGLTDAQKSDLQAYLESL